MSKLLSLGICRRLNKRVLCALILTTLLTSQSVLADESRYLCSADEVLVFGCSLEGGLVSLCASEPLSQTAGYLQYRTGKPGALEWVYPEAEVPPAGRFFLSNTWFSGGGASAVRFIHDGQELFVFDSMYRTSSDPEEPNYPVFMAGVVTRHPGGGSTLELCDEEDASIRRIAYQALDREPFDPSFLP